jgi:tyrosine-specific transport protein
MRGAGKMSGSWRVAAIVAAATIGDGVFALPFIFYQAGWLTTLLYLIVLAVLVSAAHVVYLETLEKLGEKKRLLGLTREYLGDGGFWIGFVAIVVGLLLTLVAYLILGSQFIRLLAPNFSPSYGLLIFWIIMAISVFMNDSHIVELELFGIACTTGIILLIFFTAWPAITFSGISAVNWPNAFLPFGAVLFALAGWTSVEPAYESRKRSGKTPEVWRALALGTFFVAALYVLFAAGILGSAPAIAPDTISGLVGWPLWKRDLLAIFGLIAVGTVYLPISREIKNSLEKDMNWSKTASRALILLVPIALIFLGLTNFLVVVGLVGGLFLSTQYLLIITVGRRALVLSRARKLFLDLVTLVFVLGAVYEVWTFVVH